jgi:hypothetical protein
MKKNKILSILLLVFIFIASISFPFDLMIKDDNLIKILQIILKFIFLIFMFYYGKKEHLFSLSWMRKKENYLLIPLFLSCFCNFYFLIFNLVDFNLSLEVNTFFIDLIFIFLTSLIEEILFRDVIQNNLPIKNSLLKILLSAAIFGLFHIINFLSSFNPSDLLMIIYTLLMGLVLGYLYEMSKNISYNIIYHFLFNLCNDCLFVMCYQGEWNISFYLNAVIVSVITGFYLIISYFIFLKIRKQ